MGEQDNTDIWVTKISNSTGTLIDNDLLNAISVSQPISASQPNPWSNTITTSASTFDIDDMNLENAVQIDIPEIDKDSTETAERMVHDMEGLYYDEEWIRNHPRIKKRIDIELESLRSLIKLRKANEQAHDAILNGISNNNDNASLYRALGEIQRTSLSITKQINDTVIGLDEILKQYQLDDMPEIQTRSSGDEEEDLPMHRGSKSFIKEQIKKSED